ncbi:MAG: Smr/MutS family protein [Oligoflexia bacterium]|nr:Smr/MutS family protein [Oligoflexia bacterium]
MSDIDRSGINTTKTMRATLTTLKSIEWAQFLTFYAGFCSSEPAGRQALHLDFAKDLDSALKDIEKTESAILLLDEGASLNLGTLVDLNSPISSLEKEIIISEEELFHIGRLCVTAIETQKVLKKSKYSENFFIADWIDQISQNNDWIRKKISAIISEEKSILDSASLKLQNLRKEERETHFKAKEKIQKLLSSFSANGWTQENYFDFRDGKYLIPIKAEHRRKVKGIASDRSQTGATVFIEPQEIRSINDRIRELHSEIKEEEYEILRTLCLELSKNSTDIKNAYACLLDLDLTMAKAKLSTYLRKEKGAVKPSFSQNFQLDGLYHPLLLQSLTREKIITNDIHFGEKNKCLVISGPNTGGKTVLLKAFGLNSLMAHSGFFVASTHAATLPFLSSISTQIGDDQNLQMNLSSFSGSVLQLIELIQSAKPGSLILIDEIFHSTDPEEATALSRAFLDSLSDRQVFCIVTTHLNGLKIAENSKFTSASMEFNLETLKPTYKIKMGVPGKSRAIEIATSLGMPNEILEKAKSYLSTQTNDYLKLFSELEKKESLLNQKELDLSLKKKDIEDLQSLLIKEKNLIEEKKSKVRTEIIEEMNSFKENAFQKLKVIYEEFRSSMSDIQSKQSATETFEAIKKLANEVLEEKKPQHIFEEIIPLKEKINIEGNVKKLKINTLVEAQGLGQGTLLSDPENKKGLAEVLIGTFRMKVGWEKISPVQNKQNHSTKKSFNHLSPVESIERELKLIGLTSEQALDAITAFIDRASRSQEKTFRIVHGHGSGKLKNMVRKFLSNCSYNLKFSPGQPNEGGDGCTVVEFI